MNNLIDPEWLRKHGEKYVERIKKQKEEERKRGKPAEKPESPKPDNKPASSGIQTSPRQGMIYVPSIDLYFNPERTHLGLNWYQSHEALNQEKLRMPTLFEFVEFLKFIKTGNSALYEDITQVGGYWRTEWLDNYYPGVDGKLHVQYHNQVQNGKIITGTLEELEACLMEDRTPGISLDDWLDNSTRQGLPRANAPDGKMYYWDPVKDCVARLGVGSGWLCLNCDRFPAYTYDALGVFGCADGGSK